MTTVRICEYCGQEFTQSHGRQIYCSELCRKEKFKELSHKPKAEDYYPKYKSRYCPIGCPKYSFCRKRLGDEFEYVHSRGGRWRSLRGC